MRIHLGHHFYGAGNLGDDFMVAGFLAAMRQLAPEATFTCCVPFPLPPLHRRFPEIKWLPYSDEQRTRAIAACDVWLGLGGSPFQSALSRWFVDHLVREAELCRRFAKPMFYLGVGVQTTTELQVADVRSICHQVEFIWTRDAASATRMATLISPARVRAAADLAHVFFNLHRPPSTHPGRIAVVANFDYADWAGLPALAAGIDHVPALERIWLAQETRDLPGAERALYAALPSEVQARWRLLVPDENSHPATADTGSTAALDRVLARWPSAEWLVSSRYHACIAGAWAGSKIVVILTNEKLRAVADELNAVTLAPDADATTIAQVIATAKAPALPVRQAELALSACREFVARVHARRAGHSPR